SSRARAARGPRRGSGFERGGPARRSRRCRARPMIAVILPVRSRLTGIIVMRAGSCFPSTLIGLRLERGGSGTMVIGLVAASYFAGLVAGALRAGKVVRSVGHIRAFAAFVALLSASTLTYALFQHPALWAALRLVDGMCVAGVF